MTIQKLFSFIIAVTLLGLAIAATAGQQPALAQLAGTSANNLPALNLLNQSSANDCNKPHAPGLAEYFIESGGLQRRYLLYVPSGYTGRQDIPLVFDLHGSTSFPEQELSISGLDALAEAEDFAVVAPEGIDGFWNVPVDTAKPDDVRFISDVIDAVEAKLCLNPSRIYATGFSGGGRMASQLACDLSDRIAAIGPVGGLRFPGACAETVPVITFHGTADPVNPYEGGGADYWQTGVEHAVTGWAAHNGCYTKPSEQQVSESVTRIRYLWCDDGSDVELYRIEGMGHQWPGSKVDVDLGAPNSEIEASRMMWQFFQSYQLD